MKTLYIFAALLAAAAMWSGCEEEDHLPYEPPEPTLEVVNQLSVPIDVDYEIIRADGLSVSVGRTTATIPPKDSLGLPVFASWKANEGLVTDVVVTADGKVRSYRITPDDEVLVINSRSFS